MSRPAPGDRPFRVVWRLGRTVRTEWFTDDARARRYADAIATANPDATIEFSSWDAGGWRRLTNG